MTEILPGGMPAVQMPFEFKPPPGYCTKHCGTRLSVANVDGVCDACHDSPFKPAPIPGLCTACRVSPAQPGDSKCAPCRSESNRQYYLRRQKQYATEKRAQRQPAASPKGRQSVTGAGAAQAG